MRVEPEPIAHALPPLPYVLWLEVAESNTADTDLAALIATTQEPVPEQAPPQPVNVEPAAGAAVSVTFAAEAKLPVQALPQLMPAGEEVIVPLPVPDFDTVRAKVFAAELGLSSI